MDTCSAVKPAVEKLQIFSTGAMDRAEMCSPTDLYGKPCTCNDDLYEIRYGDCVCHGKCPTAYQKLGRNQSKGNQPYSHSFPRDVMYRSERQQFGEDMEFEETDMLQNCDNEKAETKATNYDQNNREHDEIGIASSTETSLPSVSSAEISLDRNGGNPDAPEGYSAAECIEDTDKSVEHCLQDRNNLLHTNPRKETSHVTSSQNGLACNCKTYHSSVSSRESADKNNATCVSGQVKEVQQGHTFPEMKDTHMVAHTSFKSEENKYNHHKTSQTEYSNRPGDALVRTSGERRVNYFPVTFGSLDMTFTCDPSPRFILAPSQLRSYPPVRYSVPVLVPCSP